MITDHSSLTKLTNGNCQSSTMVCWSLKFAEYNVDIEHRAGKKNAVNDAPSRNVQECLDMIKTVKGRC